MNITLVACGTASPALAAECARHGIPLVACEGEPVAASGGRVTVREQGALEAMAAHCAGLGLQRIAVLSPINKKLESLREAFAAQGLAINALTPAGPWEGEGPTERLERVGYMSAQAMLNFGELPDVLYVTDDYAARGCLTALLAAGMRIPDDLQLIIHVNRRHLPIFSRPFTRIEVDPEAHGALLATTILAVLDNEPGAPPVVNISTSRFIVGETTGPRRPAGSPSA